MSHKSRKLDAVDLALAAALTRPSPWSYEFSPDRVLARAKYHGVMGLLAEHVENLEFWPQVLVDRIRQQARSQAFWELAHREVLTGLFAALALMKVDCIILKGTALAYSLYSEPALRARGDTDLLVPVSQRGNARSALADAGFERLGAGHRPDSALSLQESWILQRRDGSSHAIDLHWSLFNSQFLKRRLALDQLSLNLQPLAQLGEGALIMSDVGQFLFAAVHRAQHIANPYYSDGIAYYSADRLIWLYDLHLLAEQFNKEDWDLLIEVARQQGLKSFCLDGIEKCARFFGSLIPSHVTKRLRDDTTASAIEKYVMRSSRLVRFWKDILATPGSADKLSYVRELLLPPGEFMRRKYHPLSHFPLAFLYGRRMIDFAVSDQAGSA